MKTTIYDLIEALSFVIADEEEIVIITKNSDGTEKVLEFGKIGYNKEKQRYEIDGE